MKTGTAIAAAMGAAWLIGSTSLAFADKDPLFAQCQSIRMIMPYTAGGPADLGARLLAGFMTEDLGLQVQVENMPGAGSQIGVTEMVRAKPDGCTVGFTHLPATITTYLDPRRQAVFGRKDIKPIAMYTIDPGGLAVRGDSPFNSLSDLVAEAKAKPGGVSVSDSGVLSDGHLLLLELQRKADVQFAIVHSAGGAEGMADLLGGHTVANTINLSGANPKLAAEKQIKLLAVFTDEEVATFPGAKTAKSQGFDILSSTSRALSAPAGVSDEIVARLSESMKKAMERPDFAEGSAKLGMSPVYLDPQQTAEYWDQMEASVAPSVAEEAKN